MTNFLKISLLTLLLIVQSVFLYFYRKTGFLSYMEAFKLFFALTCFYLLLITLPSIYKSFKKISEKQKNKKYFKFINQTNRLDGVGKSFLENHPVASVICDENLNIVYKNKTFVKLTEKRFSSVQNLCEIFDVTKSEFENLLRLKEQNYSEHLNVTMLQDNRKFTLYAVNYSENKEQNSILIQLIDNSEQTELKEKFIQAQKMQAIGQLAGGVAHDFNNLLTAIIGFCDLLLTRHPPGDQSFVDLMQIKQNANRAANLVKQLLAFSRKQTMQMKVVNITDILSEISNLIRRLIGENINLELVNGRDIWDIKADKSQLEQVIINLAINARDAMPGGGMLSVITENADIYSLKDVSFSYSDFSGSEEVHPGKYVQIYFRDSGIGINKTNIKKIFEPFFTTKGVGQGTGLGLSTVSGIIEQLGGYLFVSSEEGKGTEFIILLKKYEKAKEEIEVVEEPVQVKPAKDLTGSGNILIVEDEDPVRSFSARALKNKGYNVYEAVSGENAIEVVKQIGGENIGLIISDVVMPGISGPEMVEKISPLCPSAKVVFVSGYGEDAFYQKYGTEREFNFLAKPYTLNQLAEKVKEILDK